MAVIIPEKNVNTFKSIINSLSFLDELYFFFNSDGLFFSQFDSGKVCSALFLLKPSFFSEYSKFEELSHEFLIDKKHGNTSETVPVVLNTSDLIKYFKAIKSKGDLTIENVSNYLQFRLGRSLMKFYKMQPREYDYYDLRKMPSFDDVEIEGIEFVKQFMEDCKFACLLTDVAIHFDFNSTEQILKISCDAIKGSAEIEYKFETKDKNVTNIMNLYSPVFISYAAKIISLFDSATISTCQDSPLLIKSKTKDVVFIFMIAPREDQDSMFDDLDD